MLNYLLKKKWVILFGLALLSVLCIKFYSDNINDGLKKNLLRLHIVANSDLKEDQEIKRKIRDNILIYMHDKLKDSKSIENSRQIICREINNIKNIAKESLNIAKKNYDVTVHVGEYPFPTKMYGDVVLPAGNYQALKVDLGKAEGENWWCVLFPPLCFVDATHGTIPASVKEDLKNVLSREEYELVAKSKSEKDIPIKIKFKLLEVFQGSKYKVKSMISRLFKGKTS